MDFSRCKLSGKYYGGSEKKLGIVLDGAEYMLKFRKETAFGIRNNHFSEYIGSHIFAALGFRAQETYLGTYRNSQVVACRDFNVQGVQFVPFNDVGESTLDQDKESYQYEYEDIMRMLMDNSKLTNVEGTVEIFWRIFQFPTSQIRLHGRKSSYYAVIHSSEFAECDRALAYVYGQIDMDKLENIIDETPMLGEVQKLFYKHMLRAGYREIIEDAYLHMQKGNV